MQRTEVDRDNKPRQVVRLGAGGESFHTFADRPYVEPMAGLKYPVAIYGREGVRQVLGRVKEVEHLGPLGQEDRYSQLSPPASGIFTTERYGRCASTHHPWSRLGSRDRRHDGPGATPSARRIIGCDPVPRAAPRENVASSPGGGASRDRRRRPETSRMRNKGYIVALVGSWAVTGAVVLRTVILGDTTAHPDQRVEVKVTEAQLDFVEHEMRGFLRASQQILAATLEGDLTTVAEAARRVGDEPLEDLPPGLVARLPLGLKQLGFGTHDAFSALAEAAEQEDADRDELLSSLADIHARCVACHSAYTMVAETDDRAR